MTTGSRLLIFVNILHLAASSCFPCLTSVHDNPTFAQLVIFSHTQHTWPELLCLALACLFNSMAVIFLSFEFGTLGIILA